MSTVVSNKVQVGQNADPTKNFVLQVPASPDGTLEIRRGNASAPGALIAKVNADGGVNTGGPVFSAYGNAATSVPNVTPTKILYQAEDYDTASCYDPALSRFRPNVAGYYHFTAKSGVGVASGYSSLLIYKNGAQALAGSYAAATASGQVLETSGDLYLNGTTDYVEVFMSQVTGNTANSTIGAPFKFQGHLVRAA